MSHTISWELTQKSALKERRDAYIKENACAIMCAATSNSYGYDYDTSRAIAEAGKLFDALEEL